MTRQQRQLCELLALCDAGAAARAIDLAFLHFADFGPSVHVIDRLAAALDDAAAPAAVHDRLEQLRSRGQCGKAASQRPVSDGAHLPLSKPEQGDHR